MSLKSIRQNYSKLISAFNSAGISLNESQKSELDTFIVALESKIDNMKHATIKATKKIVTEHLDKEYQKIFESILANKAKHDELVSKIQMKVNSINESKKLSNMVDNYLSLYVESILPEKTIVDYDRMKKLETLHESIKDLLVVNEDAVQAKKEKLQESFEKQKRDYETQIAKLQVKLNESMDKQLKLNNKIEKIKGRDLLESKLANLPDYEANQIRKRLSNATEIEVKNKFKTIFESVKNEEKQEKVEEETSLEEEISNILDADDAKKKNKVVKQQVKQVKQTKDTTDDTTEQSDDQDDLNDVELTDDEKINESQMSWWCNMANGIQTEGY